jgi:pyruvate kinase
VHDNIQAMFAEASNLAIETKIAKEGDTIVAVAGLPIGVSGTTNMLRVITLPEPVSHG